MAWEYVGSTSGVGTATGYSVSLTGLTGGIASAPAAGDLVVVMSAFGNTASSAPNISGNSTGAYTGIGTAIHANDTWDTEAQPFYAVMGGTPDTSLSVTRTNNAAYGGSTVVHVWRGVDDLAAFIGVTQTSGNNGCVINPPAYNPAVADALIIAGGAGTMAATSSPYTDFAGMDNFVTTKGGGTTSDCAAALASYLYAGVSYDPPTVSGGTTSTSSSWAGFTFAFRMAVAAAVDLTAGDVNQGNTTTSGAVSQTHALSAGNITQANTSTTGAVVHTHALTAGNVNQVNTTTTGVISLLADPVELTAGNVNQANTTTTGAASQTHVVTGNSVNQATTSTSASVSQSHVLTGNSVQQGNTATTGAVSQTHALSASDVNQAHTSTTGVISQTHVLAGANVQTANTSSSGAVSETAITELAGASVTQGHTTTTGAISQTHVLAGSNARQANTSTMGAVIEIGPVMLTAGLTTQANTSSSAAITQTHMLIAQAVVADHIASSSAIVQTHLLTGDYVEPGWVEAGYVLSASVRQVNTCSSGAVFVTGELDFSQFLLTRELRRVWVSQEDRTNWTQRELRRVWVSHVQPD